MGFVAKKLVVGVGEPRVMVGLFQDEAEAVAGDEAEGVEGRSGGVLDVGDDTRQGPGFRFKEEIEVMVWLG